MAIETGILVSMAEQIQIYYNGGGALIEDKNSIENCIKDKDIYFKHKHWCSLCPQNGTIKLC